MSANSKKQRKRPVGRRLIESMQQIAETLESGAPIEQKLTVRVVEVAEPGRYSAGQIRALRQQFGVSQAVFARLLGVSPELVQHWEQSITSPRPIARRLLDEISRDPGGYAGRTLRRASA